MRSYDGMTETWTFGWFHEARRVLTSGMPVPGGYMHARALLVHPRMRAIRTGGGFHLASGVAFDGITDVLKCVFHPRDVGFTTGGAATGGSVRGSRVDRELADLINHGKLPPKYLHPYTAATLTHLWHNSMKPFAAQVPVYDEARGLATTLDILAIDMRADVARGNVVNIQLKTGYDNNYTRVCGALASPYAPDSGLRNLRDSYFMRHQLQALTEHLIVQLNYGLANGVPPLRRSAVLVVNEGGACTYTLDSTLLSHADAVLVNLTRRFEARTAAGGDIGNVEEEAIGRAYSQAAVVHERLRMRTNSRARARKKYNSAARFRAHRR